MLLKSFDISMDREEAVSRIVSCKWKIANGDEHCNDETVEHNGNCCIILKLVQE